jgi:hypothetical protein
MSQVSQVSQRATVETSSKESTRSTPGRPAVPWLTVVPLAVLMAYGDGFWVTSVRGAAGAIERTDDPFASWFRESTLVLPVFVLAVLVALAVAMRWFGPVLASAKAVIATGLMVVGAGSLVGIAGIAASSAYDYSLQASQAEMVVSVGHVCASGDCLGQQLQASMELQVQAAAYGSALLLITNLVLVGWGVALRGGRLDVSTTGRAVRASGRAPSVVLPPATVHEGPRSRVGDLRLILVFGLFGTAAIHAAVVPEHLIEWGAAGAFFIALAATELVVGALLAYPRRVLPGARTRRTLLLAGVVVSISPLLLWLYSRTLGMPFGPEPGIPEAVGLADVASSVLETVTLLVAAVLLWGRDWARRPGASAHLRWLLVVAVIAVTAIGLSGSGVGWLDIRGDIGDPMISSLN